MKRLTLVRMSSQHNDTLGSLYIDSKFACFTLEDEYRRRKVPKETRIPNGVYRMSLRTNRTKMNRRYHLRFPDIHVGMLHITEVPNFKYIYIHCGNREDETDGCILVGDTLQSNLEEDGFVGSSGQAYRRIYPEIADAIMDNQEVWLTVKEIDREYLETS